MNAHKIKVIGILALAIVLTVTLGACDMDDDPQPRERTYNLTVSYEGMGETTPQPGTHEFEQNTMVNLEAVPYDADWEFAYWEGPVSDRHEASTQVFMDRDKEVNAVFVESDEASYDLTVNYDGRGTTQPEMGTHTYDANELVEIVATPAEGWEFDYWRGDVMESDENVASVYMNADKQVTAVFSREDEEAVVEQYQLFMDQEGRGTTNPSAGVHEYEEYELVELEANPAAGWQFERWDGEVTDPYSSETTLLMEEDREVRAVFVEETLDIEEVDELNDVRVSYGTAHDEVIEDYLAEEIEVTFTDGHSENFEIVWEDNFDYDGEEPDGYTFAGSINVAYEDVNVIYDDIEQQVIVSSEMIEEYLLSVNTEGEGSVNTTPDQVLYEAGTEVTLEAVPGEDWEFSSWDGDVADTESSETTIIIDDDKTVTANFSPPEYELELVGDNISSTPLEGEIEKDTEVTIEVDPEEGKQVDSFEINGEDKKSELRAAPEHEYTFTITEDTTAEVTYEDIPAEEYTLNIDIVGEGSTTPAEGTHNYEEDEEVTVEAVPADNWEFNEWGGDIEDSEEEITITMDSNKSIVANFVEEGEAFFEVVEFTATDSAELGEEIGNDISGTIENTGEQEEEKALEIRFTDKENYEDYPLYSTEETLSEGEEHDLDLDDSEVVVPDDAEPGGHTLTLWTADDSIGLDFTVEEEESYQLITEKEGEGDVEIEPEKDEYEEGEAVTLSAEPAGDHEFVEWRGDADSTSSEITITMDEDKEIEAIFDVPLEFYHNYIEDAALEKLGKDEGPVYEREAQQIDEISVTGKGWGVFRIDDLVHFENLEEITMWGNKIGEEVPDGYDTALGPLAELDELETVILNNNEIENIAPLEVLDDLETLHLDDNNLEEIEAVSFMYSLETIRVKNNNISYLPHLSNLDDLRLISFSDNNISSINHLADADNLTQIYFNNNNVEDITPLRDIEGLQDYEYFPPDVHMEDNPIDWDDEDNEDTLNQLEEWGVDVEY